MDVLRNPPTLNTEWVGPIIKLNTNDFLEITTQEGTYKFAPW